MDELIYGVPLVVVVPAVVELAKRVGLPTKWAGLVAVLVTTALVGLLRLRAAGGAASGAADVALAGLVLGLASAGLYSQVRALAPAKGALGAQAPAGAAPVAGSRPRTVYDPDGDGVPNP